MALTQALIVKVQQIQKHMDDTKGRYTPSLYIIFKITVILIVV